MKLLALLDADIVAFRCAATCEGEDREFIPISRTNELVEQILADTSATEYRLFLSGSGNFRKVIYPEYKAHRTKPPPRWLQTCREFLVKEWGAVYADGCEADDRLGVGLTQNPDAIVCSIDKDLLQVPGNHYNFVRKERIYVEAIRGLRTFYEQLLIGDATDNIKGCPGIGKAKAPRILEGCENDDEMFDCVRATYKNDAAMLLNGKLIWIWRKENDIWNHPKFDPESYIGLEAGHLQESTTQMPRENIPSTEHGGTQSKVDGI